MGFILLTVTSVQNLAWNPKLTECTLIRELHDISKARARQIGYIRTSVLVQQQSSSL